MNTAACCRLEPKGPTLPGLASLQGCTPEGQEPFQSLIFTVLQQALNPQGLALSEAQDSGKLCLSSM